VAILNVDDNGPSRFLRSRILTGAGFEVREAESAAQALSVALGGTPPSLVLLDVSLPDGDGFSVCEQLKASYPDVPVVMITSVYHNACARLEGFQSGADEYLLDPVEPARLVDAVTRFLDPSRSTAVVEPPTLITDDNGRIISANAVAANLLSLSARGLRDRSILGFFAPGRERIAAQMRRAVEGRVVQEVATIRPREKKPFKVRVDISAAHFEYGGSLEWVLEPVRDASP
jgi:DNA-binding response OmpR family regulator